MRNHRRRFQICFALLCLAMIGFTGCGKKGPPVPPIVEGKKLAPPFDLKYKTASGEVTLSWKHRIDEHKAFVKPKAFDVFMAQKTFEDCQGCPFKFRLIQTVQAPETSLMLLIDKGYNYYFRVQAVSGSLKSEYSKTVQFETR